MYTLKHTLTLASFICAVDSRRFWHGNSVDNSQEDKTTRDRFKRPIASTMLTSSMSPSAGWNIPGYSDKLKLTRRQLAQQAAALPALLIASKQASAAYKDQGLANLIGGKRNPSLEEKINAIEQGGGKTQKAEKKTAAAPPPKPKTPTVKPTDAEVAAYSEIAAARPMLDTFDRLVFGSDFASAKDLLKKAPVATIEDDLRVLAESPVLDSEDKEKFTGLVADVSKAFGEVRSLLAEIPAKGDDARSASQQAKEALDELIKISKANKLCGKKICA